MLIDEIPWDASASLVGSFVKIYQARTLREAVTQAVRLPVGELAGLLHIATLEPVKLGKWPATKRLKLGAIMHLASLLPDAFPPPKVERGGRPRRSGKYVRPSET